MKLGILFASILLTPSLTQAQLTPSSAEAVIPEPPAPVQTCEEGSMLQGTVCGRYVDRWVWGPVPEHMLGSLVLFAVGYTLQVISTAVSTAQGEHDISLAYPASELEAYRNWGYLPVVGPWAKLVLAPPHVDDLGAGLFVFEGLLQLGSIVYFVASLFGQSVSTWEPDSRAGSFRITPRATGLSFDLRF